MSLEVVTTPLDHPCPPSAGRTLLCCSFQSGRFRSKLLKTALKGAEGEQNTDPLERAPTEQTCGPARGWGPGAGNLPPVARPVV